MTVAVRLLILKHSPETSAMCNADADLAVSAANAAKAKGLDIQIVGNYFCTDKAGVMDGPPADCPLFRTPRTNQGRISSPANEEFNRILRLGVSKMGRFQDFVSQHMDVDAAPDDTLIVFTIGHGGPNGGLDNLGGRPAVMQAIAGAAAAKGRRTVWWELACFGCAGLPALDTLSPDQRAVFSVVTASDAGHESQEGVQGRIMDGLFQALATGDKSLNADGDGKVTGRELDAFLRGGGVPHDGGGPVVFAAPEGVLFGDTSIHWRGKT